MKELEKQEAEWKAKEEELKKKEQVKSLVYTCYSYQIYFTLIYSTEV